MSSLEFVLHFQLKATGVSLLEFCFEFIELSDWGVLA